MHGGIHGGYPRWHRLSLAGGNPSTLKSAVSLMSALHSRLLAVFFVNTFL
ncbi:hypothetical protein [Plesiomonas shigelloides]|nr:hypothetical protein [Plesiomonas shigelloides]